MKLTGGAVDSHVHVFDRNQTLDANRRYLPSYDAEPANLLQRMDGVGVSHAVLVQPSFLGTDNGYLISAIAQHPMRFVGIAVIDPHAARQQLCELRDKGVRGIRLNLIGKPAPDLHDRTYSRLAALLADLDMHLQIQAEGEQWKAIAGGLPSLPCTIVIDHFGRTTPGGGGFEAVLAAADASDSLWFKFSGSYRFSGAEECAKLIIERAGDDRIVWGSDWPWTQHEGSHSYEETLSWLGSWIENQATRAKILSDNPRRLYSI